MLSEAAVVSNFVFRNTMVDEMLFILFGFLLFTNITFISFLFFEHENNHKVKQDLYLSEKSILLDMLT
tara:strand:+ start:126586 stop:126789 length:204 start_codon:yes stop_codon:yes gene_type:complete